jgi:hypothetical protein
MSFFEPLYLPGFQALPSADEMQHAASMKWLSYHNFL